MTWASLATVAIVLALVHDATGYLACPARLPIRRRCGISMQLAQTHVARIQEAAEKALGHGDSLKGLDRIHELSMAAIAIRPWKTFFNMLVANKVHTLNITHWLPKTLLRLSANELTSPRSMIPHPT